MHRAGYTTPTLRRKGEAMRFYFVETSILAVAVCFTGCDTAPETVTPVNREPVVDIDVRTNDSSAIERVDRRDERRENLLDAIDRVDVDVSDGQVNVDVE